MPFLTNTSGGSLQAKATVVLLDFLILNSLVVATLIRQDIALPMQADFATKVILLVMNIAMLVAEYRFRPIVYHRLIRTSQILRNILSLVATQVVLASLMLKLLAWNAIDATFILRFGSLLALAIILARILERRFLRYMRARGCNLRTVLFVGNDKSLANLYRDFTLSDALGYRVKGYYADEKMQQEPMGLHYLGTIDQLNARLDQWDQDPLQEPDVEELYCSISHAEAAEVNRLVRSCNKNIIRFYYVPRVFEDYEMHLKPRRLGDHLLYSNREEPLMQPVNSLLKRAFDIIVSAGVCLVLLPITLIVGLLIKLQSPGPIFFRQGRTGVDGKTFYCYKFRSMHVNREADTMQATKNDPRKFAFGNFMRKTNIDELPQFFNVLKGDMSIVGPRPHMLTHTEMYGKVLDDYMVRHFCKPGITGWAQVTGYRGETAELWQMESRVKWDIWYLENWSFLLDLKIILITAKTMLIPDSRAW